MNKKHAATSEAITSCPSECTNKLQSLSFPACNRPLCPYFLYIFFVKKRHFFHLVVFFSANSNSTGFNLFIIYETIKLILHFVAVANASNITFVSIPKKWSPSVFKRCSGILTAGEKQEKPKIIESILSVPFNFNFFLYNVKIILKSKIKSLRVELDTHVHVRVTC